MEKNQIAIFVAVAVALAVRLYMKYKNKDKNKSGIDSKASLSSSIPQSTSRDDEYEPYSKKGG
jgi:hypothetical protein